MGPLPIIPVTRIDELEAAIRRHRDQKADDRCIEDDDRLYAVLGDGIQCDRRVGDKAAMLENCRRFIERRCEGGGWPTYKAVLGWAGSAITAVHGAWITLEVNGLRFDAHSLCNRVLADARDLGIHEAIRQQHPTVQVPRYPKL